MKVSVLTAAAISTVALAAAAQAAPVTPYLSGEFQGAFVESDGENSGSVAASRSDINAINEGVSGFYSLGIDGFVSFDVSPLKFDQSVFSMEITNDAPSSTFPEAARFIFSGADGTASVDVATFGDAVRASTGGISVTRTISGDMSSFLFDLNGLSFSTLTIEDATFDYFADTYTSRGSDGFDIGELQFTPVPAPGAIALFGLGFAALGLRRRRRAA